MKKLTCLIAILCVSLFGLGGFFTMTTPKKVEHNPPLKSTILAGGCFWCMQPPYDKLPGIIDTTVGYTGGEVPHPTYEQILTKTTGHVEAVKIDYDPRKVSFEEILEVYWQNIDPTNADGQFADIGPQYLTVIFVNDEEERKIATDSRERLAKSGKFTSPIATEIKDRQPFYPAEEYHQDYYMKNPFRYEQYKEGSGRGAYLRSHND